MAKIKKRSWSRRQVISLAASISCVGVVGFYQKFQRVPYQSWYDDMRTHASSGESFIHPSFKESYQPTREEQMLFAEEIRRRIQSEILIKRVSFYSGKRCTVLNISESNFNEFSKRACTITEDFFKFVGALPVPQLEFIRLRPETTFEQNSRSFQFYVIGTTAEVKRAEY